MENKKHADAVAASLLPELGSAEPAPLIAAKHKYFVGMYQGQFLSIADAISGARLPAGSTTVGELPALPAASKILVFQAPHGTTDAGDALPILIVEPFADGEVNLWSSGTDLAREDRAEAEDDVLNFDEIGDGTFKIFERL